MGVELTGNIHDQRRRIVAAQIRAYRPDVLYVSEWCPLGDAFLKEIKGSVRLVAGQICSPLRPERTYDGYDLMVSAWHPIVEYFRQSGMDAAYMKLAFDDRVLERVPRTEIKYDVTFVGGFAPSHTNRQPWLEALLERVEIDVFGYGVEALPAESPIHGCYRGQAWGWDMYRVLQESRITLHLEALIDVRGSVATNQAAALRYYEATGMGTCLVTEAKENLHELFEPGRELVTYMSLEECVEKIRFLLAHENERAAIGQAGQDRTLRDHTFAIRMGELREILAQRL